MIGEVLTDAELRPCFECGGGFWVKRLMGPFKGTFGWVAHADDCGRAGGSDRVG